jgi:methylenetetrahydrofolate dehydrogenase (NADP+)/methenyltetrahydrofolate cyclohydrolase
MYEEKILDGKMLAKEVLEQVELDVLEFKKRGITPKLVVVLVGNNVRSEVYIKHKVKASAKVGIECEVLRLEESISTGEMIELLKRLNADASVHGILVQVPLPGHLHQESIFAALSPAKDVDGFTPENFGKMAKGSGEFFIPCTALGVLRFIKKYGIEVQGKDVVVVGKSNIAGKPVALLLAAEGATVTICHSQTQNLAAHTLRAEILVVAVGKPRFIRADMVKEQAVVFDVGINDLGEGKICGDVDFERVLEKASFITPVPGGCGKMTVACLMENVIQACQLLNMRSKS